MPDCATCGNPVEPGVAICPYCNRPARSGAPSGGPGRPRRMKLINIKAGSPTVARSRDRLEREIATARQSGVKVVKVIHGYGSTGAGGGIGRMVRAEAGTMRARGIVGLVVPGEEFERGSDAGRRLIGSFPWLADDRDFGRRNRGVTFLTLK